MVGPSLRRCGLKGHAPKQWRYTSWEDDFGCVRQALCVLEWRLAWQSRLSLTIEFMNKFAAAGVGVGVGLSIGAPLGAALQNVAVGVALGVGIGVALGLALSASDAAAPGKNEASEKPLPHPLGLWDHHRAE